MLVKTHEMQLIRYLNSHSLKCSYYESRKTEMNKLRLQLNMLKNNTQKIKRVNRSRN